MPENDLKTVTQIARIFGVPSFRIRYLLDSRQSITPTTRCAHIRMFDSQAVLQIGCELEKINARKTKMVPA